MVTSRPWPNPLPPSPESVSKAPLMTSPVSLSRPVTPFPPATQALREQQSADTEHLLRSAAEEAPAADGDEAPAEEPVAEAEGDEPEASEAPKS